MTKKANKSYDTLVAFAGKSLTRLIRIMPLFGSIFPEDELEKLFISSIRDGAIALARIRGTLELTPEEIEKDFDNRIEASGKHLMLAGSILDELRGEFEIQQKELSTIQAEILEYKKDAEYWNKLASVKKESAEILTTEIERRLRIQVRQELDRGKKIRIIRSLIAWVITLILGGFIGAVIGIVLQQYYLN